MMTAKLHIPDPVQLKVDLFSLVSPLAGSVLLLVKFVFCCSSGWRCLVTSAVAFCCFFSGWLCLVIDAVVHSLFSFLHFLPS